MDPVLETEQTTSPGNIEAMETVLQDKLSTKQFVISPYHLQRVSFHTNPGFSHGYTRIIGECLANPENLANGKEGLFLEFLYKEILNTIITDQSIYLSPSSLDNKILDDIDPADLILGENIESRYICPLLLISSKLSIGDRKSINHLLNTPEITLNGRQIFGSKDNLISILESLSANNSREKLIENLSQQYGPRIISKILLDLTDIENILIEEGFVQKKPFNRAVIWKIERLRDILVKSSRGLC